MNRVPKEKYHHALQLIADGYIVRTAAEKAGVVHSSLEKHMHACGITVASLRNKPDRVTVRHVRGLFMGKFTREQIIDLLVEFRSWAALARAIDAPQKSLKDWGFKQGICLGDIIGKEFTRKKNPQRDDYVKRAVKFYEQATLKDLAIRRPWFGGALCL